MDKVSSFSSRMDQATPVWDRSSPRGHHSSVGKAVEAHRLRREERLNRSLNRGNPVEPAISRNDQVEAYKVSFQSNPQESFPVETQSAMDFKSQEAEPIGLDMVASQIDAPLDSMAKSAAINNFTNFEAEEPVLIAEVIKGSYLDTEA